MAIELCFTNDVSLRSGIFGYVSYLVEKDRKIILDTLVNGGITNPVIGQRCLLITVQDFPA